MGRKRPTPERKAIPREVFLSHASQDFEFAGRIVAVLRDHGIPVWYSPTNIIGAQQWHDEIGRALARCDWFAVLITGNALRSKWVRRELHYALEQDRYNDRIIPLLYKPCDDSRLSWTLSGFQRVNFAGDFDHGCRDLLRIWGFGYAQR